MTDLAAVPLQIEGGVAFEIEGKKLKELISTVALSYPTSVLMGVTKYIIVDTQFSLLQMESTNLNQFSRAYTPDVKIETHGRVGLNGVQLLKMRPFIPDDETVTVASGSSIVTFAANGGSWTYRLNDITRFPPLPVFPGDGVDIDRVKFIAALESVSKAAATDMLRPSLMLVDVTDQVMRASDGGRYQQIYTEWWPKGVEVGISSASVPKLLQWLRKSSQEFVSLFESEQYILFKAESDWAVARPAARFAMMDDLLLKPALAKCDLKFECDLADFSQALARVSALGDKVETVVLEFDRRHFTVSAEDASGNSASAMVILHFDTKVPEGTTLTFNVKHLTDLMSMVTGEDGSFYVGKNLKTKLSPLLYRGPSQGILGVINQKRLT